MREVQILRWCDIHFTTHEERVEADKTLTFDGRELEVCADHHHEVDALMSELDSLFRMGTQVEKRKGRSKRPPSATEGPVDCPLCDLKPKHRQALSKHLRTVHDTGIRALRAEGYDV